MYNQMFQLNSSITKLMLQCPQTLFSQSLFSCTPSFTIPLSMHFIVHNPSLCTPLFTILLSALHCKQSLFFFLHSIVHNPSLCTPLFTIPLSFHSIVHNLSFFALHHSQPLFLYIASFTICLFKYWQEIQDQFKQVFNAYSFYLNNLKNKEGCYSPLGISRLRLKVLLH